MHRETIRARSDVARRFRYNRCLMPKTRTVQIISHGPSCLDGVMAAAAIARFFEGNHVYASLPGNNESDRAIQGLKLRVQIRATKSG